MASAFIEVQASPGKDVIIHFQPDNSVTNRSIIFNGFEIDGVNPRLKAIKPSPANDDEHWPNESALTWTVPSGDTVHQLYLGTDSNAVANATPQSPEFKGSLSAAGYPLPPLDQMKSYFWRVDEPGRTPGATVKGEVWRFRVRALAFPTAEGYGRFARGGRGGRAIEVTNLQDYDAGASETAILQGVFARLSKRKVRARLFSASPV